MLLVRVLSRLLVSVLFTAVRTNTENSITFVVNGSLCMFKPLHSVIKEGKQLLQSIQSLSNNTPQALSIHLVIKYNTAKLT